jgi:glycerophosphoryl diester phosphodiesterase
MGKWIGFVALATTTAAALSMSVKESRFVAMSEHPRITVIAHRGASAIAPENTLPAFAKAVEMGADYVECDVRLSADGEVVVIHDADLERVGGIKKNVADMTLAVLKTVDVGAWKGPEFKNTRIPTLRELLDFLRDRSTGLYLEIKSVADETPLFAALYPYVQADRAWSSVERQFFRERLEHSGHANIGLTQRCIELLRAKQMTEAHRVVVQSFSPTICAWMRLAAPEIRTELLCMYEEKHPDRLEKILTFGRFIDVDGFNFGKDTLTREHLQWCRDLGKSVAVWTVDDEAFMRKFIEWGVTGIITNVPDVLRNVLRDSASLHAEG